MTLAGFAKSHREVIKILEKYYCWKSTLKEYLQTICIKEGISIEENAKILRIKSYEYQSLLTEIIIACECDGELAPQSFELFNVFCSIHDVICKVINQLYRKRLVSENVLSIGASRLACSRTLMDSPNSIVRNICSPVWDQLLSVIGTDLMIHIFQSLSLFIKMPNGCLLQLVGKPIYSLEPKQCRHKSNTFMLRKFRNSKKYTTLKRKHVEEGHKPVPVFSYKVSLKSSQTNASSTLIAHSASSSNVQHNNTNSDNMLSPRKKPRSSIIIDKASIKQRSSVCQPTVLQKNEAKSSNISNLQDEKCCDQLQDLSQKYSPEIPIIRCQHKSFVKIGNKMEQSFKEKPFVDSKFVHNKKRPRLISDDDTVSLVDELEIPCKKQCTNVSTVVGLSRNEQTFAQINAVTSQDCDSIQITNSNAACSTEEPQHNLTSIKGNFCETVDRPSIIKSSKPQKLTDNMKEQHMGDKKTFFEKKKALTSEKKNDKTQRSKVKLNTKSKAVQNPTPCKMDRFRNCLFKISQVLYASCVCNKLKRNHILRSVPKTKRGALELALDIFNLKTKDGRPELPSTKEKQVAIKNVKIPRNLLRSLPLLKNFIQRFKKMNFHAILQKICPRAITRKERRRLSRMFKLKKNMTVHDKDINALEIGDKIHYRAALLDYTTPCKAWRFIKKVCMRTLPKGLLGNKANWRQFFKHLYSFMQLKRYESMSLMDFMYGIKVRECIWMFKSAKRPKCVPKSLSEWQHRTLQDVIFWVINNYVVPLIRANFYVTDSTMHRNRIFYYRKPTWRIIEAIGKRTLLETNFVRVSNQAAEEFLSRKTSMGYGTLRFIPKVNKIRPIIKIRLPNKNPNNGKRYSANFKLENLSQVLKYLRLQNKSLFGSAISDTNDIDVKMRTFLFNLKRKGQQQLPFYFVASDINSCFDSIPHDKLIEIVDKAMDNDVYSFRRFHVVKLISEEKPIRLIRSVACEPDDVDLFPDFLRKRLLSKAINISNAIIVDNVIYSKQKKVELMSKLKIHIKQSLIRVDNKYYHRKRGITQGSSLSTSLANFLYGNMEKEIFNGILNSDDCLLMRWTDDFLLITTSMKKASTFLKKLARGIPEYGLSINLSKSLTNLPPNFSGRKDPIRRQEGLWFPWCHLLFNVNTLEVRFSYERYRGEFIGDSITVRLDKTPGRFLLSRLQQQIRMQCVPLVLDSEINTLENIRVNIYQMFSFLAVKLLYQISKLPRRGQSHQNVRFFIRTIHSVFYSFCSQHERVRRRLNLEEISVNTAEAKNIYFTALYNVLRHKGCPYHELLRHFRKKAKQWKISKACLEKFEKESEVFKFIR